MQKLCLILCVALGFGNQIQAGAASCKVQSKKTKEDACIQNAADKKEAASCKAAVADADKKTQQEKVKKTIEEKKAAAAPKKRDIHISNTIDNKKLDYSKAFFTYTPTKFDISINDVPVKTNETKSITINEDKLVITYYCEFKDGARKSSHVYTYKLNPATTKTSISFDWKKEPRITIDADNAELISDVKVDCDNPSTTSSKK